jgi:hypothetical protein
MFLLTSFFLDSSADKMVGAFCGASMETFVVIFCVSYNIELLLLPIRSQSVIIVIVLLQHGFSFCRS